MSTTNTAANRISILSNTLDVHLMDGDVHWGIEIETTDGRRCLLNRKFETKEAAWKTARKILFQGDINPKHWIMGLKSDISNFRDNGRTRHIGHGVWVTGGF